MLYKQSSHTVTKQSIGRSYKNDEFDWSFLFRDCIMRVMAEFLCKA